MNINCSLKLVVNGEVEVSLVKGQPFSIMENDRIIFKLGILGGNLETLNVELYIEDYLVVLDNKGGGSFFSKEYKYFRESCGESRVFVYINQDVYDFLLNIKAAKLDDDIVKIMEYIDNKIKNAWNIDLARTKIEVGSAESIASNSEMLLSKAEELCNLFWDKRSEFKKYSRKRLSATSRCNFYNNYSHVDPHDVINNLDLLIPSLEQGDVIINKKNYTISDVPVTVLVENTNLIENQILIGSLYSICRKLQNIIEKKLTFENEYKNLEFDNKDFRCLVSSVKHDEIRKRVERVLIQAKNIILFLEKNIGFVYNGEIRPVITHFVRGSKFYRIFFEKITEWYGLGEPSVGGDDYFVKLKSISKIYEIYCLFRIVEALEDLGWSCCHIKSCDRNLIKYFYMKKTNSNNDILSIKILYELDIYKHSDKNSGTFDLVVSVDGSNNLRPDFVIKIQTQDKICYGVIDAKYSSDKIVREKHLPVLSEKYWRNISVKTPSSNGETFRLAPDVLAIFALYAKSCQDKQLQIREYFSLDEKHGLDALVKAQPLKAGVLVTLGKRNGIKRAMESLLDIASDFLGTKLH